MWLFMIQRIAHKDCSELSLHRACSDGYPSEPKDYNRFRLDDSLKIIYILFFQLLRSVRLTLRSSPEHLPKISCNLDDRHHASKATKQTITRKGTRYRTHTRTSGIRDDIVEEKNDHHY